MKHVHQEHGYAMLFVIFTTVLISIIGLGLLTMNAHSLKTSKNAEVDQAVYYVAEAGLNVELIKILDFAALAKQFVDKELVDCNSNPSNSHCFDTNHFNKVFLNTFFKENLLPYVRSKDKLTYKNFSIPNSKATFNFTCKQNSSILEIACKDFTPTPNEELIVIIESIGDISGKTRIIKQEIVLHNPDEAVDRNGSNSTQPPLQTNQAAFIVADDSKDPHPDHTTYDPKFVEQSKKWYNHAIDNPGQFNLINGDFNIQNEEIKGFYFVIGKRNITINGNPNTKFTGTIIAPYSTVKLNGNGKLCGTIVAKGFSNNGAGNSSITCDSAPIEIENPFKDKDIQFDGYNPWTINPIIEM
ncbi:hypothetical protein MKY51_01310 [Solibacillus sp. FSL R5-0691]|uniref:hypothetical protein n=1 Tax=Solibacillus sp. FSL R5-0691 TaxID=2921653 RepID=UPI0030D40FFA